MLFNLSARAQDSTFLPRDPSTLSTQPIQEKVYLHLDKPNYGFGDTIWYKAYTVIGQRHQLSAFSGVLHVELISPKDSLVTRQIIPLVSGMGYSDIPLSHALKPGVYRIRAYTRWMQNMPNYFDVQEICIGGIPPAPVKQIVKVNPDVQFFPESGELVNGVRSRVAVKSLGVNGMGKDIKGTVEDNLGNVVADFATQHLGMGVFALIPEAGKSYKARISSDGEASFTIDLPKAQETGYTLALNNKDKDSIYIKIATNEQTLTRDKSKTFYIIAQSNGKVYYTSQGELESTAYIAKVEKNRFPEGIVQFTLFSQSGNPLAERIVFVGNEKCELKLSLNTDNQTYGTRDNVKLRLIAKDSNDKPVIGSFSVAVINESKVQPDENVEITILNNILLTSELKGFIEQPNYYFTTQNEQTNANLDILMLTQGYRKYNWRQVLNISPTIQQSNNTAIAFPPERTLELSGTLTNRVGKPVPNGSVTLAAIKQNLFRDTIADAEGKFTFTNLYVTDTVTLVLRARKTNNGNNVKITPALPEYPKIILSNYPVTVINADTVKSKHQYNEYQREQKDYIFRNGKTLTTVTVKGIKRPKQPELTNSSNLNGPGHANQVIMSNQLGDGCIDLTDCLAGKVLGVIFKGGKAYTTRRFLKMRIIVDGITLSTDASLNDVNASDIYSIEVLRSGAYLSIYGSEAFGGALVITMKHGNEGTTYFLQATSNGIITLPFAGFYKTKAFYSPKYQPKGNTQTLDNRSTIYWNPNILSDKDGKALIEYFNNDTKGTYRIVVEGIDDEGNLGRQVYRYEVQ